MVFPQQICYDHYEWNYKEVLTKMRTICHSWQNRSLSLKGKIIVFNSLVVSLLHYVAANSDLPNRVLHELKKMVVHFLWNRGSSKVAYSTLVQPIEAGGLRLADFATRMQASRLLCVRHLLLSADSFSRHFVEYLSDGMGVSSLILRKPKALPTLLESSPFYLETSASVINYITLFTKYFIQRPKLFHQGNLSLIEWLMELKKKLLTEEYICSLERKNAHFSKWTRILRELG